MANSSTISLVLFSFLLPHSLQPLARKGPEALLPRPPNRDPCHSVCKPQVTPYGCLSGSRLCLAPGKTQQWTRHGENRFPSSLQPPQGVVGDGWGAGGNIACHGVATLWALLKWVIPESKAIKKVSKLGSALWTLLRAASPTSPGQCSRGLQRPDGAGARVGTIVAESA